MNIRKIGSVFFIITIAFLSSSKAYALSYYGDTYEQNTEKYKSLFQSETNFPETEVTEGFEEEKVLGVNTSQTYNIPSSIENYKNFLLNTCGFSKPKAIDALALNLSMGEEYTTPIFVDLFSEKAHALSDENYVSLAYQCVLLRQPSSQEMNENLKTLKNYNYDDTRDFLVETLALSEEFSQNIVPFLSVLK